MSVEFGSPHAGERDRAASVDAELEAVFGSGRRGVRAHRSPVTRLGHASPSRRRTPAFAAGLGALVVAGLAVGGLLADLRPRPARSDPAPAPLASAPMPESRLNAQAVAANVAAVAPEAQPLRAAKAATRRPALRATRPSAPSASRCARAQGLQQARCLRPQILRADRELRRAYARAARAGVSNAALETYRRRWSRVRLDAVDDPARVVRRFSAMAAQLDSAAERARGRRS